MSNLYDQYAALRADGYSAENAARQLNITQRAARTTESAYRRANPGGRIFAPYSPPYDPIRPMDGEFDPVAERARDAAHVAAVKKAGGFPKGLIYGGATIWAAMDGKPWAEGRAVA